MLSFFSFSGGVIQ